MSGRESDSRSPLMTGDLDLNSRLVGDALWKHFGDKDHEKLRIVEETFPHRMRADLQRALESLLGGGADSES